MFVELPNNKGIGKLVSVTGDRCVVSVFHSVLHAETLELPLADVTRGYLSPQTRVYVMGEGPVQIGRVTNYLQRQTSLLDYEISFPNGRRQDIRELDLYVRPWNAPADPADAMAAGAAESQFLFDRRRPAVSRLQEMRAAAQGLTAIISAGVDFVPHQIAAVRRVLTDPVQRYLLADEVGLGKTIEAGLIIRQHLIDRDDCRVLISAPNHLCEQWRRELTEKLHLGQFADPFECVSHGDLQEIVHPPDVLVIDEAHHLVGVDAGPLQRSADRLKELARQVPVLLLLSATPALGDDAKFLALLNLLDPEAHPLEDLEGFRKKLDRRREFGRLLLGLDAEAPGLVLRKRASELQEMFPADQAVQDLAPRLIAATRDAPHEVGQVCKALKEHIADSYRIHQRLIRSRRADCRGWEFQPRGEFVSDEPVLTHLRLEEDTSAALAGIMSAADDWRFAAAECSTDGSIARDRLAQTYAGLLSAISGGPESLADWLDARRPTFEGEDQILGALREKAEEWDGRERVDIMVESTRRLIKALENDAPAPKVVVFASHPATAAAFRRAIAQTLETEVAAPFRARAISRGNASAATLQAQPSAIVLVFDRSNEEGLNLSDADAIVHLDLPFSAARMEQRIGRLDRYGRRQRSIRHRVLLPSEDDASPWLAWFDHLAKGFCVFNRSISDVQFLLEELETDAARGLLVGGADALAPLAASVRGRIAEERRAQDEQHALDLIALTDTSIDDYLDALEACEEDETAIGDDAEAWLVDTLQVKKRPFAWPAEDPFQLTAGKNTLIPRAPWLARLDLRAERPLTWKRRVATKYADAILLRPGNPLIDIVERFTRWDDRGTAFMTWRTAHDWPGDLWMGFRLDFVVEPGLAMTDLLAPSIEELAAFRRAQRYLTPTSYTLHLDINADLVTDETLLSILKRPYQQDKKLAGGFDTNLGSRPRLLHHNLEAGTFEQACRVVRERGRNIISEQPALQEKITAAAGSIEAEIERRRRRIALMPTSNRSTAQRDLALIERLLPAVSHPSTRLDSFGFFIVSQRAPQEAAA